MIAYGSISLTTAVGMEERLSRVQMRGKMLQPEQIANAVALLVTDEADAINGSVVMTDDGYASFK
jgi:glucose 1-dehydrogenase